MQSFGARSAANVQPDGTAMNLRLRPRKVKPTGGPKNRSFDGSPPMPYPSSDPTAVADSSAGPVDGTAEIASSKHQELVAGRLEQLVLQRCDTLRQVLPVQTRACFPQVHGAGRYASLPVGIGATGCLPNVESCGEAIDTAPSRNKTQFVRLPPWGPRWP